MTKQTKQDKEGTKKSKENGSKKEKLVSSVAPLITTECQLRKVIKDKKKENYTVDEAKNIYHSVQESKSGFPIYMASIYPEKVTFKPTEKGKKMRPVEYTTIGQIIQIPEDLQSFLLHVPKSKKAKSFTALFAWLDPQMSKRFEKIVHQANNSLAMAPLKDNVTNAQNKGSHPRSDASNAGYSKSSLLQPPNAPYFATSLSPSVCDTKDLSSDLIRVSKRVSETYTYYCPNRTFYRSGKGEENHNTQASSGSTCSSDSSYGDDSEDSDCICRDKESVFYGERMSPKSQYIDRLLRATVQMQNENRYS
ncbi:hypothetical protein EGR_01398 [Echinococcus granulosus]|uniref:Expressed conserved protein n=1 Tax=Echinococcus granulosus TaxID=6210 RepID=U6J0J5_ECHGR|nr:hypothetical protein EGR_01398 [Echinococcus granulosus]EUB63775.1 hypothetical protein EGR_01398 [Echinococcus granulosus]CDS15939.1 expressed conserved protein [Echinococcus granulosus]